MHEEAERSDQRFRPLRPESRRRVITTSAVGPLVWLVAVDIATVLIHRIDLILDGVLVIVASCLIAAIVLSLLWLGRRWEERRYAHRA